MGRRDDEPQEGAEEPKRSRPALTARDTWRLIFATYRESLPYLLVVIAGLLIAAWVLTEIVF